MTEKRRVFTSPSAFPNPQRLRLFMLEKGIHDQFEEVVYDMTDKGEQRRWPHLKRNPFGETPTLELADGGHLSESPAIARFLDQEQAGNRPVFGATPEEQGRDAMWDNRVFVHILYKIVTMFHVKHEGLGFKLEKTHNPKAGEDARKAALASAATVDAHLSDGRQWLLGGDAPTFADCTLCTAIAFGKFGPNETPLDEWFEHLDAYWQRWQGRDSFRVGYADGGGLDELAHLSR